MRFSGFAVLVLTTATTALASRGAAAPKLAVVDLSTPPAMLGLGQQITQAVVNEAKAQGFQVVAPDDLVATLGAKPYEELQNCAGRAECSARKLEPLGVDKALLGTLARDEKNYLVRLWLVDVHQRALVSDVNQKILIASRRLMADVKLALPDLLQGKTEARGTLRLSANVKAASVTVDGEFAGKTPIDLDLKPGKHEIKLDKKAYLPITRLVTVVPKEVTVEELRLILIPGETPEDEQLPAVAHEGGADKGEGAGVRLPPVAWACVGFSVLAAGTGGALGYATKHLESQFKTGLDSSTGIYTGTRSQALGGRQDALFANIAYGASGVGLAAAVVLTVLLQNPEPPVQVAPTAGKGAAGLILEGRF